jgi:hypothetical protein
MQNLSEKYMIVKGTRVILTVCFDTEEEAKQYIQDTRVRPCEWNVEKVKDI